MAKSKATEAIRLFGFIILVLGMVPGKTPSFGQTPEDTAMARRLDYVLAMEKLIIDDVNKRLDEYAKTKPGTVLKEEAGMMHFWMRKTVIQAAESYGRARQAGNPAEREVWLKEARLKADAAERSIEYFVGGGIGYRPEWAGDRQGEKWSAPDEAVKRIEETRAVGRALQQEIQVFTDEVLRTAGTKPSLVKDLQGRNGKITQGIKQFEESLAKAEKAASRAECEFWFNDAQVKRQSMERWAEGLLDAGMAYAEQAVSRPKLKPMTGFASGILYEMGISNDRLEEVVIQNDPATISIRAEEDFGTGRAGAGGVSLHKAARFETPPDMGQVKGVAFEGGRLVLLHGQDRIPFPPLDPEYLALAIRSVYGKEGMIKGELMADEPDTIVVRTGREMFGDVAWKKEFLPAPWIEIPLGQPAELSLGPAIGVLSSPEPSSLKVSYYGPIRNTKMGRVLLEADGLLPTLLHGVDWKTGLPIPPPPIEGFMSGIERTVRRLQGPAPEKKETHAPGPSGPRRWWAASVWYVWVPDEFTLGWDKDGKALRFLAARMKLSVWSSEPENITEDDREFAEHVSENYGEFARSFPVLKDLEEVAKAVSIVRWLGENRVPVDRSWTERLRIEAIQTPARLVNHTVIWMRDAAGKPLIER